MQTHSPVAIGPARDLVCGICAIHGGDERSCERPPFVSQAHGQVVARVHRVRVAFGQQLQREAQGAVALVRSRSSRKHQRLGATRKQLVSGGIGLIAAGPQRCDRIQSFLTQILVEGFGR